MGLLQSNTAKQIVLNRKWMRTQNKKWYKLEMGVKGNRHKINGPKTRLTCTVFLLFQCKVAIIHVPYSILSS
jgi:hypothetical protein